MRTDYGRILIGRRLQTRRIDCGGRAGATGRPRRSRIDLQPSNTCRLAALILDDRATDCRTASATPRTPRLHRPRVTDVAVVVRPEAAGWHAAYTSSAAARLDCCARLLVAAVRSGRRSRVVGPWLLIDGQTSCRLLAHVVTFFFGRSSTQRYLQQPWHYRSGPTCVQT